MQLYFTLKWKSTFARFESACIKHKVNWALKIQKKLNIYFGTRLICLEKNWYTKNNIVQSKFVSDYYINCINTITKSVITSSIRWYCKINLSITFQFLRTSIIQVIVILISDPSAISNTLVEKIVWLRAFKEKREKERIHSRR